MAVPPDESIALALQTMLWTGFRHLPVVDGERLVGVITERDLFRYQATQGVVEPTRQPIRDAMSKPVHYADAGESLAVASERMAANKIGCLPILELGKLVGIVTTNDVLRAQLSLHDDGVPLSWSAKDVMTFSPVTTTPDEFLVNAIAKMSLARVRHLPVLDGQGHVVGMLSDRDVRLHTEDVSGFTPRLRDERLRVRSVMSRDVISVRPDASPSVLLTAFTDWRLGALPVVDAEGRLIGVVSYIDVLNYFAKSTARDAA
jgi:acetoin utilization protein AcuB